MPTYKIFFRHIFNLSFAFIILSSCKKEKEENLTAIETGFVIDIDGNKYATVKIGNKWWMAENLKVKKFRNGKSIQQIFDPSKWNVNQPAFCLFQNSDKASGLLYNGYTICDTSNLAPEGWHVATEQDWKDLEAQQGMPGTEIEKLNWRGSSEGDMLKVAAPFDWTRFGSVWGNNKSGFNALSGGCILSNGHWSNPGLNATGFWWSSTQTSEGKLWFRHLDYKKSGIFRFYESKNYGMSVRCVKD